MNKIKDFIYDKNDLLVALIIVALATLVIVFRVDTIMAYPSSSAGESKPPVTDVQPPDNGETSMGGSDVSDDDGEAQSGGEDSTGGDGENADGSGTDTDNGSGGQTGESQTPPDNRPQGEGLVSIYIEYGATGSDIAKLLMDAGLVKTRDDFYDAVRKAGADTKLQAGSFKIPANATPDEIIKIITN